jgi:gas vesicle protein
MSMRNREFWIALGVGAVAGGVVALLYAPQSGAQTRKKLRRGIEDAGEALEEAGDYLRAQAEYLSHEAQKLIERSKDQFEDALDAASGAATRAAKSVQKLV